MLETLKRFAYPFSLGLIPSSTLVEGRLRGSEMQFRCLFVHRCAFTEGLKARCFEDGTQVVRSGRLFVPALRSLVRRKRSDFDLCVAVLPANHDFMFRGVSDFTGRETIRQVIDTSGTWDEVRHSFSKTKRQVTNNFPQKFGLDYRISREAKDFDHFYHKMFVPHIEKRFGMLSQIDSYAALQKSFANGFLLLVTREGQPVAAALSVVEGKSLAFRRTGVLDGDESHIKGGAQLALYYFQLKYCVDHGLETFNTMKSAPFLNDGVFKNKGEWGARTLPDHKAENTVHYFARASSEKLAHFFALNPLVVGTGAELMGVVGDPQGHQMSPRAELPRRYHTVGLRDLRVYAPDGVATLALEAQAVAAPARARVSSRPSQPAPAGAC